MWYLLTNFATNERWHCATLDEAEAMVNQIVQEPDHPWDILRFEEGSTAGGVVSSGVGPIPAI